VNFPKMAVGADSRHAADTGPPLCAQALVAGPETTNEPVGPFVATNSACQGESRPPVALALVAVFFGRPRRPLLNWNRGNPDETIERRNR
ncbi:MAG: hypothetical protein KDI66_08680, partial [Xanthomonadales bacterium]|nr:hypothetical protein [Xanthomonadales bacterium]